MLRQSALLQAATILAVLLLLGAPGLAGGDPDELAAQLQHTSGKERIAVLVELVGETLRTEPARALSYGKEALQLLEQYPGSALECKVLDLLATAALALGDGEAALSYARRGVEVAEAAGMPDLQGTALISEAMVQFRLSQYRQAQEALSRAREVVSKSDHPLLLARILNALGVVHRNTGEYETALERLLEALEINQAQSNSDGTATNLNNLGLVYWNLGDLDHALEYFKEAEQLYSELKNLPARASVINNIGLIYHEREQHAEALEYYREAYLLKRQLGDRKGLLSSMLNISAALSQLGEHQQALDYVDQALELGRQLGDQSTIANAMLTKCEIQLVLGRTTEAANLCVEATRRSRELGAPGMTLLALETLSKCYERNGQLRRALEVYREYKELNDQIVSKANTDRVIEMKARFEAEQQERELELLKRDQAITDLRLKRAMALRYGLLAGIAMLLVVVLVLFRTNRLRKRYNEVIVSANTELAARKDQLERVTQIMHAINSESELEPLLAAMLSEMGMVGAVQGAVALVWDRDHEAYRVRAAVGRRGEEDLSGLRMSAEQARSRFVETGHEVAPGVQVVTERDAVLGWSEGSALARCALALRIEAEGEELAYLVFENFDDANAFAAVDMVLVSSVQQYFVSALSRVRMLADLRRLNDKKNEFLGMAAHDLRSPLGLITSWADVTLKHVETGRIDIGKVRGNLHRVVELSRRLAQLVSELLDWSAIEAGRLQLSLAAVNPVEVLEEAAQLHSEPALRKQISLEVERVGDMPLVRADRERLLEVMDNLVSNALKYTEPGGRIRVHCDVEDNEVRVSVSDNGVGLNEEDVKAAFRSFGRLSARPTAGEPSTGLGLAIVRKVIAAHHGRVWVESEVGKGSTFGFALPVDRSNGRVPSGARSS